MIAAQWRGSTEAQRSSALACSRPDRVVIVVPVAVAARMVSSAGVVVAVIVTAVLLSNQSATVAVAVSVAGQMRLQELGKLVVIARARNALVLSRPLPD